MGRKLGAKNAAAGNLCSLVHRSAVLWPRDAEHRMARGVGVSMRCRDPEYRPQDGVDSVGPADSGPGLLIKAETQLAEPEGRMHLGQFETPQRPGITLARCGCFQEPFGVAVVI